MARDGGCDSRDHHRESGAFRHCEERSDEAIHSFFSWRDGLLRFARNDEPSRSCLGHGATSLTAETIIQSLASGLLMGLLYGLIAVGLGLIFGLMDVVNFAHGEFLMIAMYATFFLFAFFAIEPLLAAPLVAAALFVFGAVIYLDRKSTRLNSSHANISYAVFCLKKKNKIRVAAHPGQRYARYRMHKQHRAGGYDDHACGCDTNP